MESLMSKKSYIVLIGSIVQMPFLSGDKSHCFIITVKKNSFRRDLGFECIEHYNVILSDTDAEKVIKFGSCGMSVCITGDFSLKNAIEITATKIDFISPPNTSQYEFLDFSKNIAATGGNHEMHYWFDSNGFLRTEYTYLH